MSEVLSEMTNRITTQIMYYTSEGKNAKGRIYFLAQSLHIFTVTDTLNIFHIVQIFYGKLENDR